MQAWQSIVKDAALSILFAHPLPSGSTPGRRARRQALRVPNDQLPPLRGRPRSIRRR